MYIYTCQQSSPPPQCRTDCSLSLSLSLSLSFSLSLFQRQISACNRRQTKHRQKVCSDATLNIFFSFPPCPWLPSLDRVEIGLRLCQCFALCVRCLCRPYRPCCARLFASLRRALLCCWLRHLLSRWRAVIVPLCSSVSIVLFGNTMDFISSLHHARESKRRVVCAASQRSSFSGSSVDALFQARAARAAAQRDTLPPTAVAADSVAQVRRLTAVPVVAETPCSDYINGLRRSRAARTIGLCVQPSSPQIRVPRIPALCASPRHPLRASILSAAPVSQVLSVPVCGHPLRGAFLRGSTLPAVLSCANTCVLRKAVLVRRAALQPLDTEKAR